MGGTCLIFVRGCGNVVSETVHFLLQFFSKKTHPFSCVFGEKGTLVPAVPYIYGVPPPGYNEGALTSVKIIMVFQKQTPTGPSYKKCYSFGKDYHTSIALKLIPMGNL